MIQMKVIKKTKERVLSIVLAFAMVLSSMTGLAPMEVRAEVEPEVSGNIEQKENVTIMLFSTSNDTQFFTLNETILG